MGRRRQRGRPVNGLLILDKPQGLTSNQALQTVKHLFDAAKAGHTGSLDPLATGVLPICFGDATKFTQFLLEADKRYLSTFLLGVATNTGDMEGAAIAERSAAAVTAAEIEAALDQFRGSIEQVPPMFSALKHQGEPLYRLARQGIEVERHARPVEIRELRLLAFRAGERAEIDVEIACSKGTYVRTLAADLGVALGCGAHVAALQRIEAGPFQYADATDLPRLEQLRDDLPALDALLKPVDAAVSDRTAFVVLGSVAWLFRQGQAVMIPRVYQQSTEGDIVRIFHADGPFLGVGEVLDDGRVKPRRLVAGV